MGSSKREYASISRIAGRFALGEPQNTGNFLRNYVKMHSGTRYGTDTGEQNRVIPVCRAVRVYDC